MHQSDYDKKVRINLRNSQVLKKSQKKRPKSRFREYSENPSRFANTGNNTINISQNFSMVKGKGNGLNYSVLGHSQFLDISKENNNPDQELSAQASPKRHPDYLDRVLNLEYPSPKREIKTLGTPKYNPDLVEMVKNIFGTESSAARNDDMKRTPLIFEPSPVSLQRKNNLFDFSAKRVQFGNFPEKPKLQLDQGIMRRGLVHRVDCSDVIQNIRQRQLYRRPLQLFRLN